jgi:glycolate dehydrogenase FAD-linked subunit
MTLKREIYRALEDVLGPENISEDPVIIYADIPLRLNMEAAMGKAMSRFEAVTLPQTTAEVQAVVRLCNRYKIQFKAASTGWGFYSEPGGPNAIRLDLRRMNRIIEINEKNMYAVVEPYVIFAQLQAELMKRGLNCNITGAGSNCSALPIAAHQGLGHLSISGSYGERNLLAVEWVTPEGEIIGLGSLGSSGAWFCGDGPGPSLRGIIRGNVVPLGGLGVFTKAASKLYHWPGPATFSIEGVSPHYHPSIPANFMIRYISFPSAAKLREAVRKVGESEIGFILMGFNPAMMASNISTSNNEDAVYLKQFADLVQGPGMMIIIAGNSPNDFEYKKQALQQIMEEYSGESLKAVEDPQNGGGFMWRFIRVSGSIREVARASGIFGGQVAGTDVFPLMHQYIMESSPVKERLIKQGWLLDDGTDPFVQSVEHGHQGHAEMLIRYNPNNPNGFKAQAELGAFANKTAIEGHFGVPGHAFGDAAHDMYGPHTSNYHLWLRALKKTFDPNAASEATHYVTPK